MQISLIDRNELLGEQHPAGPLVQNAARQLVCLSNVSNLSHALGYRLGVVSLESAVQFGMIMQRLRVCRLSDRHCTRNLIKATQIRLELVAGVRHLTESCGIGYRIAGRRVDAAYAVLDNAAQGNFACLEVGSLLTCSSQQPGGVSSARTVDDEVPTSPPRPAF